MDAKNCADCSKYVMAPLTTPELSACASCEAGSFELDGETHRFLTDALGRPLADLPSVDRRVVALADRAVSETAAHHGQVRFKAIA